MKRRCKNASQTSIIKMEGLHPIPWKKFDFNWMKSALIIFFLMVSVNILTEAQELVEKEGVYLLNDELFTGKWKTHFDNGNTKLEASFKNGMKNGKTLIYFEDGQVNEIRSYKKNEMHGKWTVYNNHNIKISVAHYKNGQKHGKWYIWNDYGNLLYKLNYNNGEKTGVWKSYNDKGELVDERKY